MGLALLQWLFCLESPITVAGNDWVAGEGERGIERERNIYGRVGGGGGETETKGS